MPPLKCSFVYLYFMASQIMNEIFNKNLDPFVYLCYACGHTPACCWCRLCHGGIVVRMLGRQRCMRRRWNWTEEPFQEAASSAIHLIPYSSWSDGHHSRISACDAIDLDMMHAVCVGEIGDKPDLSLPPLSLLICSGSVNLSGSFYPLRTSFATSTYPLMACWHE